MKKFVLISQVCDESKFDTETKGYLSYLGPEFTK